MTQRTRRPAEDTPGYDKCVKWRKTEVESTFTQVKYWNIGFRQFYFRICE